MKHPDTAPKPKNPKAVAIGVRIRSQREQKGLTQDELGAMLGLTDNAITQYETGRAVPKSENLEGLAVALDVSVEWLLTGNEPDEIIKAQTKAEMALLSLMRSVPVASQDVVLGAVQGMVASLTKK